MDSEDWANFDDWELVNDNGFVYKRKKRPLRDSIATSSAAHHQLPSTEEVAENLRERKKRTLIKLRDKFREEIRQWELMSETIKDMETNALAHTQERQGLGNSVLLSEPSSSEDPSTSNSTYGRLVDDLLCQVEAQDAVIHNVSNLCDIAEALCSAHEERLKQQLDDLPIWDPSPRELLEALSER